MIANRLPDFLNQTVSRFAPSLPQTQSPEKAERLETKRQQLQEELILLKSAGTDAAAASYARQQQIQDALKEIQTQLKTTRVSEPLQTAEAAAQSSHRRFDRYQPETSIPSPGLYQIRPEKNGGYSFLLSPFEPE